MVRYDERFKSGLASSDNFNHQISCIEQELAVLQSNIGQLATLRVGYKKELEGLQGRVNSCNEHNSADIEPMFKEFHQRIKLIFS